MALSQLAIKGTWPKLISCAQGVDEGPNGLKLISEVIGEQLGIPMSVLMGANIASEVAEEKFCETTIGESPTTTHTHDAAPVTSPPDTLPSLTPLSHLLPIRQAKEEDPIIRGEGGLGHPQGKGCRSCLGHMCEKESRIPPKALLLPTLGCKDQVQGQLLKELMQTPNFRITVVPEVDTVEICGALKVRGV